MGYRDDFYIPQNITGYTGCATSHPTVYFERQCFFGRITQNHDNPKNIGRALLQCAGDYFAMNYSTAIANVALTDTGILNQLDPDKEGDYMFEFFNGRIRHSSRSTFTSIENSDTTVRSHLFTAIHGHPRMKIKHIRYCIYLYHKSLDDSNYFERKVIPRYGYTALSDLKRDIDDACENVDMGIWLARNDD